MTDKEPPSSGSGKHPPTEAMEAIIQGGPADAAVRAASELGQELATKPDADQESQALYLRLWQAACRLASLRRDQ